MGPRDHGTQSEGRFQPHVKVAARRMLPGVLIGRFQVNIRPLPQGVAAKMPAVHNHRAILQLAKGVIEVIGLPDSGLNRQEGGL